MSTFPSFVSVLLGLGIFAAFFWATLEFVDTWGATEDGQSTIAEPRPSTDWEDPAIWRDPALLMRESAVPGIGGREDLRSEREQAEIVAAMRRQRSAPAGLLYLAYVTELQR